MKMNKTDFFKFFIFFIGMACVGKYMSHLGLIIEYTIIFYLVFIGFYLINKKYQQMYNFIVSMAQILFLRYIVKLNALYILLIVLVFPLIRKVKINKIKLYWNKFLILFKLYIKFLDYIAENLVNRYIRPPK